MKFKVGDKVRYLGSDNNSYIEVGSLGTIIELSKTGIYAKWNSTKYYSGVTWYANLTEIELVEETKTSGGKKNDSGKPSISLIPKDAIWGMAQALTFGAGKYGRHNFREGIAFSRLADAAQRHLTAWMEGENKDNESGLSHLDHALASLAMLKFMDVNRSDMDDRWLNPIYSEEMKLNPEEIKEIAEEIQKRGR